jgi:hypothetical protein
MSSCFTFLRQPPPCSPQRPVQRWRRSPARISRKVRIRHSRPYHLRTEPQTHTHRPCQAVACTSARSESRDAASPAKCNTPRQLVNMTGHNCGYIPESMYDLIYLHYYCAVIYLTRCKHNASYLNPKTYNNTLHVTRRYEETEAKSSQLTNLHINRRHTYNKALHTDMIAYKPVRGPYAVWGP